MFRLDFSRSSLSDNYHMLDKPKVVAAPKAVTPVETPKVEEKPVEVANPAVAPPKVKAKPKPAVAPVKPVEKVEVKPVEKVEVKPIEKVEEKVEEKPKPPEVKAESPEPRPRLRVIHKLLNPTEGEPKPKRVTEMSGLWKQAQAKGLKGYNKMKKADLIKALA